MTPLARLQAAIQKLEQLKAESTPGRWGSSLDSSIVWATEEKHSIWIFESLSKGQNADLIVTLHRTLDAQLAWLRDQHRRMLIEEFRDSIPLYYRYVLALADAILGSES